MLLDRNLLTTNDEAWKLPPELRSCWNARGLYDPLQFVLRLRPDIQRELETIKPGVKTIGELTYSQIQAYSTYFHETIHWWQHIGSTLGLMYSLLYPAQAHINHKYLLKVLSGIGPIKSIRTYNLKHARPASEESETDHAINTVLNNWHDIEYFRWITFDPKSARKYVTDRYFEGQGHSFEIAIRSLLWLISSIIDPNLEFLHDPQKWEPEFKELKEKREEGFYYGSAVHLPPIGAREIFEGQARFCQIQFLYEASGGTITWNDFERIGMLGNVYKEAFELFLKNTGSTWPDSPDGPLVGLFLLLCDLSINPTDGFPHDIIHFPSLILSVDPGMRFLLLCQAVAKKPSLLNAISRYSREEYLDLSQTLCDAIACLSPIHGSQIVAGWAATNNGCKKILEEEKTFNFEPANLPVRLFFSRFLRFQIDKLAQPQFFCWPGIWTVGDRAAEISMKTPVNLIEEHKALFIDGPDGDVYPRIFPDKDPQLVQNTFNSFYGWVATYQMTRQWIIEDGPFDYAFFWLTSKYTPQEMKEWAVYRFQSIYNTHPDGFQLL